MSDLDAAVTHAKSTGKADVARLGVTGFCWGGFATWNVFGAQPGLEGRSRLVRRRPQDQRPDAANPVDIAGDVKCPVFAFYGG